MEKGVDQVHGQVFTGADEPFIGHGESVVHLYEGPLHAAPRTIRTIDRPTLFRERAFDVVIALGIIAATLPLMLLCVLAIAASGRGPILFRHRRIGLKGQDFLCLKFRTMNPAVERSMREILRADPAARREWEAVRKLAHDPRVTPIGHFLRRYSLDELPQLFNVLRGDMSICGPRPIVADEIDRYGPRFADYCSVKPGLTGLWQVSGLHDCTYGERIRFDSEYARTKSLTGDFVILLRTVPVVLFGSNE